MQITRREAIPAISTFFTFPLFFVQNLGAEETKVSTGRSLNQFLPPAVKLFYLSKDQNTGKFSLKVEKDETKLKDKLKVIGIREQSLDKTAFLMRELADKFNKKVSSLKHSEVVLKESKVPPNNDGPPVIEVLTPQKSDYVTTDKDFKDLITVDNTAYPLKVLNQTSLITRHGHPTIVPVVPQMEFDPSSIEVVQYVDPYKETISTGVYFEIVESAGKNGILVDKDNLPLVIVTSQKAFFVNIGGFKTEEKQKKDEETNPQNPPKKQKPNFNENRGRALVAMSEGIVREQYEYH